MVQRPRSTVLITGFDPFSETDVNPRWPAVQDLHGRQIMGHRVVEALIRQHKPSLVLCVEQAGGRRARSL